MKKREGAVFESRGDRAFGLINAALLCIVVFIMAYPLYFTIIASISDPYEVVRGNVYLLPSGLTLEPYANVFKDARIWTGYRNSLIYTSVGTLFNLFYNMVIARVFYERSIPGELYESARIDGADNLNIFVRIALPLSAPIIAVMALYYAVARWNSYFDALIYISNDNYQPLQMVLRSILLLNQQMLAAIDTNSMTAEEIADATRLAYMAEGMKYALIFIASAPMLIAYPFVQKHFVKGVMIGSLKG